MELDRLFLTVSSITLADLIDDAAAGAPHGHRVTVGHLHEYGYHLN